MKTKTFLSVVLGTAFIGATLLVGCKKNQFDPASSGDSSDYESKERKIASNFDPDNWDDATLQSEVFDFVDDIDENNLEDLNPDQMVWYVEAGLNYKNANYIEYTDAVSETFQATISISNGSISGTDIVTLFNTLETHITNYKSTLPVESQNVIFIDVEADNEVSNGTINLSAKVVCASSAISQPVTNAGAETNFEKWHFANADRYLPFIGSDITPACGFSLKYTAANLLMAKRANGIYSGALTSTLSGGSGSNAWVNVPVCGNNVNHIKWNVGIREVDIEGTGNPANLVVSDRSTYPKQNLTRNWMGNGSLANGCVDQSEFNYYSLKTVSRSKSVGVYTSFNIDQKKRPISVRYRRSVFNSTNVWQEPIVSYARCQSSTPH